MQGHSVTPNTSDLYVGVLVSERENIGDVWLFAPFNASFLREVYPRPEKTSGEAGAYQQVCKQAPN